MLPKTSAEQAVQVGEKLRQHVENIDTMQFEMQDSTTVSIGVSCISSAENIDELIEHADQLLYQAKHLGRNRVETILQN